jgi:predicted type IV restriction endonuclease
MGKISERFSQLVFHNEAEVSQKFVIPLLVEFLGYGVEEILPEFLLPSFDIPLNREKVINSEVVNAGIKPDYIIALNGDISKKIAILDSKGPNENLNLYLQQLIAYCIALKTNLIAITNGKEFQLLDANEVIFKANDLEELDLRFEQLRKLLHKENISLSFLERIKSLDGSNFLRSNKLDFIHS